MEHNLELSMYSLKDLLQLFKIKTYNPTHDEMIAAKKQVLMTHPDKSKLPSEYFLFYKKAYDMVLSYYKEQTKQSAIVEDKPYVPLNEDDEETTKIKTRLGKIDTKKFSKAFNEVYEKVAPTNIDKSKNEWFQKDEPAMDIPENITVATMVKALDTMRSQQVVVRRDVQEIHRGRGSGLYDDDEDGSYIGSDPFGKLRFDDLRRVHKDETVFNVRETDINHVTQYKNAEHLARSRKQQESEPLDQASAIAREAAHKKAHEERMAQKRHAATLKTIEHEKNSGQVMATLFYRLTN